MPFILGGVSGGFSKTRLKLNLGGLHCFSLSAGKVLGPHRVSLGGFPRALSLAGAAFAGLCLWHGDAPHLSWVPGDNQGLGSVLKMVQGGTLCQGWP